MKRILLLVAGAMTLAIAGPAAASSTHANNGSHARSHKPAQHHVQKAKHVRTKHFHSKPGTTDPNAPGAVSVASFADGTLTLKLANGSTVSGNVTSRTHIGCVPARTPKPASTATADQTGDDQGGTGSGDDGQARPNACTTANLVADTIVHQAILKIRGGVATFKLVLLVKQPAA
jgi:hypothetical protein